MNLSTVTRRWAAVALITLIGLPGLAEAGLLGRATRFRKFHRTVPKSAAPPAATVLEKDGLRDVRTPAPPLREDRTVHRWTTAERARDEARRGLPPGWHMTARGGPGHPLAPEHAQKRYGLPQTPETRMTIRLPKGTPVQHNKVVGGERGVGELRTPWT